MPTLEVTAQMGEDIMALVAETKASHPEYLYPNDPEFRTEGYITTAILYCTVNDDYAEPEEVEEPTTCSAKKLLGGTCGRDLPCRYHK